MQYIGLIFFFLIQQVCTQSKIVYKLEKYVSVNMDGSVVLIKNINNSNQFQCLGECSKIEACVYAEIDDFSCRLYNSSAFNYLEYSGFLIPKLFHKPIDKIIKFDLSKNLTGLQNYWPFTNNSYGDIKSRKNISGSISVQFTADRFGNPISALKLNNGYAGFPDGIFFNSDFTMTFWLKLYEYKNFTIIEFANSYTSWFGFTDPSEQVKFYEYSRKICLKICNTPSACFYWFSHFCTIQTLNLNEWYHLGFVSKRGMVYIFLNGTLERSAFMASPQYIIKTLNYLGRSPFNTLYSIVDIDDIKIYNRALASYEIKYDLEEK